jgi:two-component system nitrogen regulation response regulator GlnG/two-component system response regulator HydG
MRGIVGESAAVWALRRDIEEAARRPRHTLILGPSGAGKELVARAIHGASERRGEPMVARNAAAIPEGLVDAELFGNMKGYPNPGMPERAGLIGQANGTTLFLDEIGELPPSLQAHLLRVLDEGEYHRLGETTTRRSNFRLIGATNRPPSALKHDVLARFEQRITVPGLGERREDIPLIITHLLRAHAYDDERVAERFFPGPPRHTQPRLRCALVEALVRHPYTTHVRELNALLLSAMRDSPERFLELPKEMRRQPEVARGEVRPSGVSEAAAQPAASGVFTAEEEERLAMQRRNGFSTAACGNDPAYPGTRQTADLHLRLLICKALRAAAFDIGEAARLLAGDDGELRRRARERVETFVTNLEGKLGGDASEEARQALLKEWRGAAEVLEPVLDALRDRRIRGRGGDAGK